MPDRSLVNAPSPREEAMNARLALAILAVPVFNASVATALVNNSATAARSVAVRADASMGSVVSPGEPMSFEVQPSSDACIVVFDIDTRGQVRLLYPSGEPGVMSAREPYRFPEEGSELIVGGGRGVEFVFALAVDDPSAIDRAALATLAASDLEGGEPYRIEGDPFLAANTIAGDLVRDVSRSGASFGYTYFYVSERVDHPCYLCGPCDGAESACAQYQVTQNFDQSAALSYPLRRGYELTDVASAATEDSGALSPVVVPSDDGDVVVNFYPYGSEVRYVDPNVMGIYTDSWWYDPYYWYYPGWYPYYPGFSVSIGFGWGWGWGWGCWGGYYCSGWYAPGCGGYYGGYYGGNYPYPTYPVQYPAKYKSAYKSGAATSSSTLARNRTFAAQKDGTMRIASANVRPSVKKSAAVRAPSTHVKGRTAVATRAGYTRGYTRVIKSRPSYTARDVARTQMSRPGATRSGSKATNGPRMRPTDRRSNSASMRSRGANPSGSRSRGIQPHSSSGSRGHYAPRSSHSSAPHSRSAPASRGGGSRPASRGKGR
jgi:Domain of unknown function (DUF4384)